MAKVAIIGRPNTGKSTLFNRLIRKRKSITLDEAGVTRDRIYGEVNFQDKHFTLIDTGGITSDNLSFNEEIKLQAEMAIEESDLILFVVDGKEGLTHLDKEIDKLLKKSNKKVLLVLNKMDSKDSELHKYDFYELGYEEFIQISAENNMGIYELLEEVMTYLPESKVEEDAFLKIAIVGKPNVGKSSLFNNLAREDKVIVSNIPGTTRDSTDTNIIYDNKVITFIDTAGLRRKSKIKDKVENYSTIRTMEAIEKCDIALLLIDSSEPISEQDTRIAGYILNENKGVIIVPCKSDIKYLGEGEFTKEIKNAFKFMPYAPINYISNMNRKGIDKLLPLILKVNESVNREINTSLLNKVISDSLSFKIPPSYKGKRLKVYFAYQTSIKPTRFVLKVNDKGLVHFSYERYLENSLRSNFDFTGTPIILEYKNKGE